MPRAITHTGGQAGRDGALAPPATLLHQDRRIALDQNGISIGRRSENDVVLEGERVSRHHARVASAHGRWYVADLDSMNGTVVNGDRLKGESRWLASGDTIVVGDEPFRFVAGERTQIGAIGTPLVPAQVVEYTGGRLTLGRDPSNDVVLADPNVSRFHAEVAPRGAVVELRDLASSNGTRVNGQPISTAPLETGAEIAIGPYRILFDGRSLLTRNEHRALRLDAARLTVDVSGKRILSDVSLSIRPGELLAIIGESGAGKSTLVKALAGVSVPTYGRVTLSGEPVRGRLTDIGYVPQDEIVHGALTVREALGYAARLRLPDDAGTADVESAVARVLREVELENHADTRVDRLSGGQRKRAGVAVELIGSPSLLFLDEPTTGLDPELETRMMASLRLLANGGRAVTVVTHATKNLNTCDRLVVMGRGGELTFFGTPAEALEFFGVRSYDDIYRALKQAARGEWRRLYETGTRPLAGAEARPVPQPARPAAPRRALPQARVLTARYVRLLSRDRRNLLILLGQVPLLGFGMAALFSRHLFEFGTGHAGNSAQLLFLLVTTAIWIGSIDAAREIVKERSVFVRESSAGVRLGAYLLSKATVLCSLAALQTVALAMIVLLLRPLRVSSGAYISSVLILVLTSTVAVMLGLVISSVVRSQDQATSFIPLALIPQLFFAGAIVPVPKMGHAIAVLSKLVPAQWSFAGVGTAAHMNARIAADEPFLRTNGYGMHFFEVSTALAWATLGAFVLALLGISALLLRRRTE